MVEPVTKTKTPKSSDRPQDDGSAAEPARIFAELVESGLAQARDSHERVMAATEGATEAFEEVLTVAAKGSADCHLKMIEMVRANANAAYDFAGELLTAKSLTEAIELSTSHARRQIDTATEQFKELSALAQKVAADTAEPIKVNMARAFKQAA